MTNYGRVEGSSSINTNQTVDRIQLKKCFEPLYTVHGTKREDTAFLPPSNSQHVGMLFTLTCWDKEKDLSWASHVDKQMLNSFSCEFDHQLEREHS